jgi:hypothetical protein
MIVWTPSTENSVARCKQSAGSTIWQALSSPLCALDRLKGLSTLWLLLCSRRRRKKGRIHEGDRGGFTTPRGKRSIDARSLQHCMYLGSFFLGRSLPEFVCGGKLITH